MDENKVTRRSSFVVLHEKIKVQEDKIARLKEQLRRAEAKLEELKNYKPKANRISEPNLIAKICKHPEHLKELSAILAVDDAEKRRNLLEELRAKIESQKSNA